MSYHGSNGIESLAWKETSGGIATFFMGVQDTGKIYEIGSDGKSTDGCEYDGDLGAENLSAASFDGKYLWSLFGERDQVAVIDPERDCTVAIYTIPTDATDPTINFPSELDKEGLAIDFVNGMMYLAVDQSSDEPSIVASFTFTYPTELATLNPPSCINTNLFDGASQSCTTFAVCSCDQISRSECEEHPLSCKWEGTGDWFGRCISNGGDIPPTPSPKSGKVSSAKSGKVSTKAGKSSSGPGVTGTKSSDDGGYSNSVTCDQGNVVQILQSLIIKNGDITKEMTLGDLITTLRDDASGIT